MFVCLRTLKKLQTLEKRTRFSTKILLADVHQEGLGSMPPLQNQPNVASPLSARQLSSSIRNENTTIETPTA